MQKWPRRCAAPERPTAPRSGRSCSASPRQSEKTVARSHVAGEGGGGMGRRKGVRAGRGELGWRQGVGWRHGGDEGGEEGEGEWASDGGGGGTANVKKSRMMTIIILSVERPEDGGRGGVTGEGAV